MGGTTPGSKILYDSFMSTTLNQSVTDAFSERDSSGKELRMEIRLREGSPAAYIEDITANSGEDEILVNAKTEFTVVGLYEDEKSKTLIWESASE